MYYYAAYIRYYNFTITYDSTMGWTSKPSTIYVQFKDSSTIFNSTMPTFTNHGGTAPYYSIINPSLPFTVTVDSSTGIMSVSGLSSSYIGSSYSTFSFMASDNSSRKITIVW